MVYVSKPSRVQNETQWRLVIYINPKNSSIKCSRCNHISKENRISQEKFKCQKCSLEMNADLNASINILAEGQAVLACGVLALVDMKKQELEMQKPILVGIS